MLLFLYYKNNLKSGNVRKILGVFKIRIVYFTCIMVLHFICMYIILNKIIFIFIFKGLKSIKQKYVGRYYIRFLYSVHKL